MDTMKNTEINFASCLKKEPDDKTFNRFIDALSGHYPFVLYSSHSYFPAKKTKLIANKISKGLIYVHKNLDTVTCKSFRNIDWNTAVSRQPNSYQLYLHTLNPLCILCEACLAEKEKEGKDFYIKKAVRLFDSWLNFASAPSLSFGNIFIWGDHTVAGRTFVLLLFLLALHRTGAPLEYRKKVYSVILYHGEWLRNDSNYTPTNNHGIMQDRALVFLGVLTGNDEWLNHAVDRLVKQKEISYTGEHVHVENSSSYAQMVYSIFKGIQKFLEDNGKHSLSDRLGKTSGQEEEYLEWLTMPNRYFVQMGDSGALKSSYADHATETKKLYPLSGMYFYRSRAIEGEDSANRTYKMFKCGFSSRTHKHADDLSFVLYSKGKDIFTDCGYYGYGKSAYREYLTSALAHNTVTVDDLSYVPDLNDVRCNAVIYNADLHEEYDIAEAVNKLYTETIIRRSFVSADDMTFISDRITSDTGHTYSQLFHLNEGIEIISADDREVRLKINDEYIVRLVQYLPAKLSVLKGDVQTPGYGIVSRKTNKLAPTVTLKFDTVGRKGAFITGIFIVDGNGCVRHFDKKLSADDISVNTKSLSVMAGSSRIKLHTLKGEVKFRLLLLKHRLIKFHDSHIKPRLQKKADKA